MCGLHCHGVTNTYVELARPLVIIIKGLGIILEFASAPKNIVNHVKFSNKTIFDVSPELPLSHCDDATLTDCYDAHSVVKMESSKIK